MKIFKLKLSAPDCEKGYRYPVFSIKAAQEFVAKLENASSLDVAMDLLAESAEQLGFQRVDLFMDARNPIAGR